MLPEAWMQGMLRAARFGGAMMLMPGLSSRAVPGVVRWAAALGVGLAGWGSPIPQSLPGPEALLGLFLREWGVGMLIGFAFAAFLGLVEWVAEMVDWQAGFGFSAWVDPATGFRLALFARAAALVAGVLFFQWEGPAWMLETVARSYRWLPLGSPLSLRPAGGEAGMALFVEGFLLLLPWALPALGTVLLVDVALGAIGRAAPQLSVPLWGMPVRILAAWVMAAASLPLLFPLGERLLHHLVRSVPFWLAAMR